MSFFKRVTLISQGENALLKGWSSVVVTSHYLKQGSLWVHYVLISINRIKEEYKIGVEQALMKLASLLQLTERPFNIFGWYTRVKIRRNKVNSMLF